MEHVSGVVFVAECIYRAVSNPDLWVHALEAAKDHLQADAILLLYGDVSAGVLRVVEATGFDRRALDLYVGGHGLDDPLIRESLGGPSEMIVSSARLFRGKDLRSTGVYRQLLQPSGLFHIAGAAAVNTGSVHASLWMARSEAAPDFSVRDLHLLRELLPHVACAMSVHHRVRQAELEASLATGAFDRVAVGVVLLDVKGAPVMVNREAKRILDLEDGFSLLGDGPAGASSNQTGELRELIREVGCYTSPTATVKHAAGGALRLTRPSGRPDFHLVVLPLPMRCQPGRGGAVVVLFITDPEVPQSSADYLFAELYSLTEAENRLVFQLLEGRSLTDAAVRLGLSRNTVHSQLASIFQKTGTRRQSELLRLLLGGIAPVRAPDEASGDNMPAFRLETDGQ